MKGSSPAGAQTERRGDAGPVRGLLGGKDLTGRFHSTTYSKLVSSNRRGGLLAFRGAPA
jgi:hypothetical protein